MTWIRLWLLPGPFPDSTIYYFCSLSEILFILLGGNKEKRREIVTRAHSFVFWTFDQSDHPDHWSVTNQKINKNTNIVEPSCSGERQRKWNINKGKQKKEKVRGINQADQPKDVNKDKQKEKHLGNIVKPCGDVKKEKVRGFNQADQPKDINKDKQKKET